MIFEEWIQTFIVFKFGCGSKDGFMFGLRALSKLNPQDRITLKLFVQRLMLIQSLKVVGLFVLVDISAFKNKFGTKDTNFLLHSTNTYDA
jgi:hypothetical protein